MQQTLGHMRARPGMRPVRSKRALVAKPVSVAAEVKETKLFSGSSVRAPAKGKHFLHLDDFSKDELLDMLDKAKLAKSKFYARDETFKPFAGQTMAMIFTKPSARTRVSFETVRRHCLGARHPVRVQQRAAGASGDGCCMACDAGALLIAAWLGDPPTPRRPKPCPHPTQPMAAV